MILVSNTSPSLSIHFLWHHTELRLNCYPEIFKGLISGVVTGDGPESRAMGRNLGHWIYRVCLLLDCILSWNPCLWGSQVCTYNICSTSKLLVVLEPYQGDWFRISLSMFAVQPWLCKVTWGSVLLNSKRTTTWVNTKSRKYDEKANYASV